ncbi:SusD/RagB family nutrient-binding outer membrane lipoprotein, partial [Segatella sp.]|uniref:SusD/RagB family nutrient-binding outer membrane lipoprotein n=1 Tax=Segatella sp. TaxID=2974253 RepID=UPI003AAE3BFA
MSRFLTTNRNIELLEPYEGKLSRTVLRGEGGSNALDLPDNETYMSAAMESILTGYDDPRLKVYFE